MVDSISKTRITRAQAETIAASLDGRTLTSFRECEEGWFNAVYRLGFDDGTESILKIAPPTDVRVLRYEHDLSAEPSAVPIAGTRSAWCGTGRTSRCRRCSRGTTPVT